MEKEEEQEEEEEEEEDRSINEPRLEDGARQRLESQQLQKQNCSEDPGKRKMKKEC